MKTNPNSHLAINLSNGFDSHLNKVSETNSDEELDEKTNNPLATYSSSENEDEDLFLICSEKSKNSIISSKQDNSKQTVPDLFIEDELFNSDLSKNSKFNFPNVYNVLQCLTLKSANDNFDLERYEILGVIEKTFFYYSLIKF